MVLNKNKIDHDKLQKWENESMRRDKMMRMGLAMGRHAEYIAEHGWDDEMCYYMRKKYRQAKWDCVAITFTLALVAFV